MIMWYDPAVREKNAQAWEKLTAAWKVTFHTELTAGALEKWPPFTLSLPLVLWRNGLQMDHTASLRNNVPGCPQLSTTSRDKEGHPGLRVDESARSSPRRPQGLLLPPNLLH